jgi:rhamnopyranosyl-N-acetylglucosaminyl-diphospho-decaprenol beta-1,3/1,4-galactofuranosyltransferase
VARVVASVVTFNRKDAVVACLEGLASQTAELEAALVIDNGSTDGTEQAIAASGVGKRLPILYMRLERNVGAAGGYHVAFREALSHSPDWIWVTADDVVPATDALAKMLRSAPAHEDSTAAICPAVVGLHGRFQPEYSGGPYRRRQPLPLSEDDHLRAAVRIDHASFMGMLVRSAAVEAVGFPMADFFLSGDDLEWFLRLRPNWSVWLVPPARVVHQDETLASGLGPLGSIRRALRPIPEDQLWKVLYTFRNMAWIRRRYDGESPLGFAVQLAKQWGRVLLADRHKLPRMRLFLDAGLAGRRGEFDSRTEPADLTLASPPRRL